MPVLAFSNNDIAVVAWTFDKRLDGCLGFAVHQIDAGGKETVLPALARFAGQDKNLKLTTDQAPIQKFWWKDLFAKRGGTYTYKIVAMGGTPGGTLTPLEGVEPLISKPVTLTEKRPPFSAYFNRGIVATQALSHALNDHPSIDALAPHITDPNDPIRISLEGQLFEGVTSLLDRADNNGGTIHAALYELNDPKGLEKRLQANPDSRNVILGNEWGVDKDNKPIEDADAANRAALKTAGVTVIDRILGKGSIPHNKFMVLSQNGAPTAVLSGSTNWTSTGLCTQTNNALVIESREVGQRYMDYWNALQADITAADGNQKALQSATQRSYDHTNNANSISQPIDLGGGVTVEVMFSPNTNHKLTSPPKEVPNDMQRVFDLVNGAKQAVLFLAFDPGNNSILDAAGKALAHNPDLFVRGALTSAQRASNFSVALHQGGGADQNDDGETPAHAAMVKVVGEPGKPKKKGAPSAPVDFRVIPAGAITASDAFGGWEAELAKYGFAIIHNKIVVIDPFSDNCTVITGSHNLGFRASSNNDENMVIIRGHRGLSEAYACHVLDIYDHYAFRFLLKEHPDIFGRPLQGDDKWQDRYIMGPTLKSPELRFWLAAAATGAAPASVGGSSPSKPSAAKPSAAKPSAAKPSAAKPSGAKPKSPSTSDGTSGKSGSGKKKPGKKPVKKAAAAKKSAKKVAKTKAAKKTAKKATKKTTKKKVAKKVAKKTTKKVKKAKKKTAANSARKAGARKTGARKAKK
jgi:phosphatidylserine/phosphatidylglycerophosphate/cardiolipin synthase-like enzyme